MRDRDTVVALVGQGVDTSRIARALREIGLGTGRRFRTLAVVEAQGSGSIVQRSADDVVELPEGLRLHQANEVAPLLAAHGVTAVVPGLGSGEPIFPWAKRVKAEGWRFIGPSVASLRRWLEPLRLRQTAQSLGIATVPWSGKVLHSLDEVKVHAARLGFPVLLRAPTAVQTGLGVARSAKELETTFAAAVERSAQAADSNAGGVLLERLLPGVRRLEVPVVSFPDGRRWILDVIDASLRRRDGSVIVEAPAPGLDVAIQRKVRAAAAQFAEVLRHEHVGTMAFLYRPGTAEVTFLGYDFGRGGEHAAAEMLRGIDLAKLRVALGLDLPLPRGGPPEPRGHAMAAQLRVEPSESHPILMHFRPASGPGVRTDSDARAGDRLSPQAAVAEIIAHGTDRWEALARLRSALAESAYIVRGGETSMSALLHVTRSPELEAGPVVVDWWIEQLREGELRSRQHVAEALLVAAADTHAVGHVADREAFVASAAQGRPATRPPTSRAVELELDGEVHGLVVTALDIDRYEVLTDAGRVQLRFERGMGRERVLICGGTRYAITTSRTDRVHEVLVNGEPYRIRHLPGGVVRADFPAIVVGVDVAEGEQVAAGDPVATLEAMNMELVVASKHSGRVRKVLVQRGQQVSPSQPLVWLESARSRADSERSRVDFGILVRRSAPPPPLDVLQSFFRGFDVALDSAQEAAQVLDPASDLGPLVAAFIRLLELGPASPEIEDAPDGGVRLGYGEFVASFLTTWDARNLPQNFLSRLQEAAEAYGATSLERTPELVEALFRLHMAMARRSELVVCLLGLLGRQLEMSPAPELGYAYRGLLDRLIALTQSILPEVCETARAVQFRLFDGPHLARLRAGYLEEMEAATRQLEEGPSREAIERLISGPLTVTSRLMQRGANSALRAASLEVLLRRYYRSRQLSGSDIEVLDPDGPLLCAAIAADGPGHDRTIVGWLGDLPGLIAYGSVLRGALERLSGPVGLELAIVRSDTAPHTESHLRGVLSELHLPPCVDRVVFILGPSPDDDGASNTSAACPTFVRGIEGFAPHLAGSVHPMTAERLGIDRLCNFDLELVAADGDIHAFLGTGKGQPEDRRIFVHAEVRDLTAVRDDAGRLMGFPELEQVCAEALALLRRIRRRSSRRGRAESNRLEITLRPPIGQDRQGLADTVRDFAPAAIGLGLEEIRVNARDQNGEQSVFRLLNPSGLGVEVLIERPSSSPIPLMSKYEQKVAQLRRRGLTHPYDLARRLTPDEEAASPALPRGHMEELDLDDETGTLLPVDRPPGENVSSIIVGRITTFTEAYPEGMTRVALFGDPSQAMGSLAEPECRRIIAALDLAEELDVPLEWYAISGGAEISKESGTENMDWISAVLRRIIDYTQKGRELNVVVCGINVGAQSYWNAEATMLMHTKGVLVMVPGSAMVVTGKQALDFSGGVSAEDNLGIGGYDRIMGPNGQAQYFAENLISAGKVLLRYYAHSYRAPGERFPRRRHTSDPVDRDVCTSRHGPAEGSTFATVGEVFSREHNPGRKRPFDIRSIMRAVADQDHPPLERWRDMRDAETVVTWDAHLGGRPVALLGIESRPIKRMGLIPGDGPKMWTAGTLVPQSSRKMARSINAASGNRPLVVLANLSGFDGSPESMRKWQLEYGAEIGRAIVNFDGPIAFTVVSRFHGGAFVVFSNRLHENMETFAVEGSYASVIGGGPAAAVVFAGELSKRIAADPRVVEAEEQVKRSSGPGKAEAGVRLRQARGSAHAEHLAQLAKEYDDTHSVARAQRVGSVHHIIAPERLRPELIAAVERGIERTLAGRCGG
ncbi:MAG: carboxyl transferase domain-containing protein [Myxococcota bacterium]